MRIKEIKKVLGEAERHCAEKGVRFTPKRKQVLEALLDSDRALSAYELADYCRAELGPSIAY